MEEKRQIQPTTDWVKACRQNDRGAQMMLYKNYSRTMYNTAHRIVNNSAEAEDIMQEAFIHAFQKIHQLSEDAGFGAWLRRIVVNRSLDAVKKRKTWYLHHEQYRNQVDDDSSVCDEETDCRMQEIQEGMSRLPDQYRTILSLHFFEGMDYEELMQILDLKYNNVKTRIARAKSRLLEEIMQLREQKNEKEVYHAGH
ncbi:MAG: sigma-70 family RNA polymerase sigma factor [Bacteroidales bacterium]|nr:sigma-70 family RNA polymerase sigma factor [Bacteroidales bacterium]